MHCSVYFTRFFLKTLSLFFIATLMGIVYTPVYTAPKRGTETYHICDSPLPRLARSSFSPLQKPRQNLQNHCQISCVKPYPTWFACRPKSYPIWCRNITRRKKGFAQICSDLGKSVAKLRKLTSESRAKMVNATFASLFTTPCSFGMQMRHLLSLPQIYILVYTLVRHICKEQI